MSGTIIGQLRPAVLAAVKTVFQSPAVLTAMGGIVPNIYEGKTPEAWFIMNLAGTEAVVVSYAGTPLRARGPLGKRDRDRLYYQFQIALCSGDWADPVGALYTAADLSEYLLGSPALPDDTPNLRTTLLANIYGDDIYLRYAGQAAKMAPNSSLQGGRSALVSTWETFPEVPQ